MFKKIFQRLFLSPAEQRYDDAYTQAKLAVFKDVQDKISRTPEGRLTLTLKGDTVLNADVATAEAIATLREAGFLVKSYDSASTQALDVLEDAGYDTEGSALKLTVLPGRNSVVSNVTASREEPSASVTEVNRVRNANLISRVKGES